MGNAIDFGDKKRPHSSGDDSINPYETREVNEPPLAFVVGNALVKPD
jgi:hypothetical protein